VTSPDYPDYATPQAHASAIAVTGVPLLAAPARLYTFSGSNVLAAGSAGTVITNAAGANVQDMSGYLSYEVRVKAKCTGGTAIPLLTLHLDWFEELTAAHSMYSESWTIAFDSSGAGVAKGTGPVRAGFLQASVDNLDTVNTFTLQEFRLQGTSRPAPDPQSDWRMTSTTGTTPGFVKPVYTDSFGGIAGYFSGSIPGGATLNLLPALSSRLVTFNWFNVSVLGPAITATPMVWIPGTGLVQIDQAITFGANGFAQKQYDLPRSVLAWQLTNPNAAAGNYSMLALIS
jgi:hypothetical protein